LISSLKSRRRIMATFMIYPIFMGRFNNYDISCQIQFASGQHRYISFGCILLKNNQTGEYTLLDTGYATPEEILQYDLPYKNYLNGDRTYTLVEELSKLGVKPVDIKRIGITHLHQDHCWNLQLFPNVPIYVQKEEIHRASTPRLIEYKSYQRIPGECCPAWTRGIKNFIPMTGDYEIESGLKALYTPGHTKGSQSFLIDTEVGQYIYTGDQHMCTENVVDDALTGWYNSVDDWYESQTKIKATGAHILGTHMNETYSASFYG